MQLKLYDSLSRKVKTFDPISPGEVKLYVCGVTPYNTDHLGHLFVFTVFDALQNYFHWYQHKTIYTQNITDVDAPLFKKARVLKQDWQELRDYWVQYMLEDFSSLNITQPDNFPKASESIAGMIKIIAKLLEDGYAYESGGNIYFDTTKYPDFGKLVGAEADLKALSRGEDVGNKEGDPNKRHRLDFPLWVSSGLHKDDPLWQSPWGAGQPGWHIECSAMSHQYLGAQIDIHGGGADLKFPHHSAELAQTESYTGEKPFVNFWMHVANVGYQGEKMSKSKGNLVAVKEIMSRGYTPEFIRYYLLSHHYREPWEFSWKKLAAEYKDWLILIQTLEQAIVAKKNARQNQLDRENPLWKELMRKLENDFDTAAALKHLKQKLADPLMAKDNRCLLAAHTFLSKILGIRLTNSPIKLSF